MIVDCHSHIWPALDKLALAEHFSCLVGVSAGQASTQMHTESSEPADFVLVLGFVSSHLQTHIPNSFISSYVASHSDKMIGFAGIDPTQSQCIELVSKLRQEEGFRGVTLSPACQNFHPCDTRAMRLYEALEKLAMPIYFLQGEVLPASAVLSYAQPSHLDEVAGCFPQLKMVISHFGFPWVEQTIALLAKHPNVYADLAGLTNKPWQAYRTITLAYEFGVIEKLLFASDFPNHTVKTAAEALYNLNKITLDSVLPAVPREQLRGIVERNSLSLLGLAPAAARREAVEEQNQRD